MSFTEYGLPFFGWFNVALNIIWFLILAWIAWDVYKDKPKVKGMMLFLTCLVVLLAGFDLFAEGGSLLLACISVAEALFLVAAYIFLLQGERRGTDVSDQ